MLYGYNLNNEKILPYYGGRAICPSCKGTLIAKCGIYKIDHWAHQSLIDCDTWNEGETEWHKNMKHWLTDGDKQKQEVVISKDDNTHRADCIVNNKVIELQNSPIDYSTMSERETFYENMVWIINGEPFYNNFEITYKENYCSFRWKWGRKIWSESSMPVYIHLKDIFFRIKQMYDNNHGWGKVIKPHSLKWFLCNK
jgi:competence CoiA-like predicted nuclease